MEVTEDAPAVERPRLTTRLWEWGWPVAGLMLLSLVITYFYSVPQQAADSAGAAFPPPPPSPVVGGTPSPDSTATSPISTNTPTSSSTTPSPPLVSPTPARLPTPPLVPPEQASPTPPPAPSSAPPLRSTQRCYVTSDYFEVCHVTDVCYDGRLFLFHPRVAEGEAEVVERRGQADFVHLDATDDPIGAAHDDQQREQERGYPTFHFPFGSRYHGFLVGSDHLTRQLNKTLEWTDEGTWLSLSTKIRNIWLWGSTQVMPLFSAQILNHTLGLRLPPMQLLLSESEFSLMDRDTWELVIPDLNATRVVEKEELYSQGYVVPEDKHDEPSSIKCFRNMVLLGEKTFLVGGYMEAAMWRKRVKRVWGLPRDRDGPGPLKIVIVDRPHNSYTRYFENLPAMKAVLTKYGLPYQVVDLGNLPRVKDQAALLSDTQLLITMHGAGLTNVIFLPPRAVVIEIFPYHVFCPLYSKPINLMGLTHLPLFSLVRGETVQFDYTPGPQISDEERIRTAGLCEQESSLLVAQSQDDCWTDYIRGSVITPLEQFELSVLQAVDYLGRRIWPVNSSLAALEGVHQGGPAPFVPHAPKRTDR